MLIMFEHVCVCFCLPICVLSLPYTCLPDCLSACLSDFVKLSLFVLLCIYGCVFFPCALVFLSLNACVPVGVLVSDRRVLKEQS